MTGKLETDLKAKIKASFGDMKSFANYAGIPNTTLDSMFRRGILSSSISNVILLANALNISVDALSDGKIQPRSSESTNSITLYSSDEILLIEDYRKLNPTDREYIRQTTAVALHTYSEKNNAVPDPETAL